MRPVVAVAACAIWPSFAMAQTLVPGATMVGIDLDDDGEPVVIRTEDCARLVGHTAAADVVYQPGVDAAGDPVAPADLSGGLEVPTGDEIVIAIEIDLAAKYGIPPSPGRYGGIVTLGKVAFVDGKAHFNGRPLTSDDERALAAACQRYGF